MYVAKIKNVSLTNDKEIGANIAGNGTRQMPFYDIVLLLYIMKDNTL